MGTRRDIRVAERRRDVAAQYLRGAMQSELAVKHRVSQSQISLDLKHIRAEWLKSALIDFDEAKARELARIDVLEREYWQAWERSQEKREKTLVEKKTGIQSHDKSQIRREEHVGDARFLDGVRWCIEQRLRIFGVYDADKQERDWKEWLKQHGIDPDGLVAEFASFMGARRDYQGSGGTAAAGAGGNGDAPAPSA